MCNIRTEDRISTKELRTRLKLKSTRNIYRIDECNDMAISKEWKRELGLVNVEHSR